MRAIFVLLASVLALAATGCVGFQTVYRNADWFVLRGADQWLCPQGERRVEAKRVIDDFRSWHQQSELPRWIRALDRLAKDLREGDKKAIERAWAAVEATRDRSMARIHEPLVRWLGATTEAERTCFATQVSTRHEDRTKRRGDDEEAFRKEATTRAVEWAERLVGPLSDGQKKIVDRALPTRAQAAKEHLAQDRAEQRFLKALKAGPEVVERTMTELRKVPNSLYPKPDRAMMSRVRARWKRVLLDLGVAMTSAQRVALAEKVSAMADALRTIRP